MTSVEISLLGEVEKLRKDLDATEHALTLLLKKYEVIIEENNRLAAILKRHSIKFE